MTNYFKIYLRGTKGWQKIIAKNKSEVIKTLNQANKEGFATYIIVKRIKPNTDILIGRGSFSRECKVVYVDGLDTDWRVVGHKVVDWQKYKNNKEEER